MSRCGDVYANAVTGEHALVLRGDEDGDGRSSLVLLTVAPGGAVVGSHLHPGIEERFRVLSGSIRVVVDGDEQTLSAGEEASAPPGVAHDWWNAEDAPARVLVSLTPPEPRFETMIATLFGLANDGKTNDRGLPNPLQLALIAREFDDVIRFTAPPRPIQRAATAVLAPVARIRGYRSIYPAYLSPHDHIEPDRQLLREAGLGSADAPADSADAAV